MSPTKRTATAAKRMTHAQLQEENSYLRAMIGQCLECGRERDAEDTVRHSTWLDDETGFYHSVAHFGGGAGGAGKTLEAAMKNAVQNMLRWLRSEGARSLTEKPWRELKNRKRKVRR